MNIIDRTISHIAPTLALKRARSRAVLNYLTHAGYVGASINRRSLRGWTPWAGDADADTLPDMDMLRRRSRDLFRNAPLATGALNTIRTNVVGPGLRLQSRIDREFLGLSDDQADAWERGAEREFALWAESQDADATRTDNFYGLQSLAFLSALLSGDCFAVMPMIPRRGQVYDLRVQVLEADRVQNPYHKMDSETTAGGVEVDGVGAPVAYHLANSHPGSMFTVNDGFKRLPAFGARTGRRNVIHLYDRLRPGQRRGVPILAPVIDSLKQLARYSDAELMAAVVSGMFTVFVKTDLGVLAHGYDVGERLTADPDLYEMGNGSVVVMDPGEDITLANPQRPNQAFEGFMQAIMKEVGSALELPYEILIKHFSASYSASRAAFLEAWKFFKSRRAWLAFRFCQLVYEEWLCEAVAKGRLAAPGFFLDPAVRWAWSRAEWTGPAPGQIDPLKEVEAAVIRVDNGFATRSEETQALTGGDWETKHRQRAKEERMRQADGLAVASREVSEKARVTDAKEE